jgi:hypothetical protein
VARYRPLAKNLSESDAEQAIPIYNDGGSYMDSPTPESDRSLAIAAKPSIQDHFDTGDLQITWVIAAPSFNTAQVKVFLQSTEVANHQFSPGNTLWQPPQIAFGGDTLDFEIQFVPASATANGELTLVSMKLTQASGGPITIANMMLQGWDSTGGPQLV